MALHCMHGWPQCGVRVRWLPAQLRGQHAGQRSYGVMPRAEGEIVSNPYADTTDTGARRAADVEARPAGARGGLFAGLGRAVVRHPWRVIALWVIAAVAVIATAPEAANHV